jgi:hypothetical protein
MSRDKIVLMRPNCEIFAVVICRMNGGYGGLGHHAIQICGEICCAAASGIAASAQVVCRTIPRPGMKRISIFDFPLYTLRMGLLLAVQRPE